MQLPISKGFQPKKKKKTFGGKTSKNTNNIFQNINISCNNSSLFSLKHLAGGETTKATDLVPNQQRIPSLFEGKIPSLHISPQPHPPSSIWKLFLPAQ